MLTNLEQLLSDDGFRRFVLNPNQAEHDIWDKWINESEANRLLFEEGAEIIRNFYQPLSPEEFQSEAIRFKRSINITSTDKIDIISLYENRRPKKKFIVYKIAASLILMVSTLFILWWYFTSNPSENIAINSSTKIIKREVERGLKLTLTFQDGTKVKLNSESSITYPEEFASDKREVTLVGEAFFDVAHNEEWPFIVNVKNTKIQVLGTSFNVNSFDNDAAVCVALVDGKVEIKSDQNSSIQLHPMEMAVIDQAKNISVKQFNLEKVTAWKDNKIIFEKASFDEIEAVLERWFNVEFIYDQKPEFRGGYTVTTEGENLDNILKGMSSDKFGYDIKDSKVYIN